MSASFGGASKRCTCTSGREQTDWRFLGLALFLLGHDVFVRGHVVSKTCGQGRCSSCTYYVRLILYISFNALGSQVNHAPYRRAFTCSPSIPGPTIHRHLALLALDSSTQQFPDRRSISIHRKQLSCGVALGAKPLVLRPSRALDSRCARAERPSATRILSGLPAGFRTRQGWMSPRTYLITLNLYLTWTLCATAQVFNRKNRVRTLY